MQKRRSSIKRIAIAGPRPDVIIGIDPGANAGIAVVTVAMNPALLYSKRCRISANGMDVSVSQFLDPAIQAANGLCCHSVVEDQYVGINLKTAIVLSQRAGQWIEACLARNIPVDRIGASSWQARELPGMKKREMLKKAAQAKALGIWGYSIGADAADAALMARYRAIKIAYEGWHGTM